MNNELAKVCPAARSELTAHCADMAMLAIKAEGIQTLMLPGPAVTAAHEAGHAVLHAVPRVTAVGPFQSSTAAS